MVPFQFRSINLFLSRCSVVTAKFQFPCYFVQPSFFSLSRTFLSQTRTSSNTAISLSPTRSVFNFPPKSGQILYRFGKSPQNSLTQLRTFAFFDQLSSFCCSFFFFLCRHNDGWGSRRGGEGGRSSRGREAAAASGASPIDLVHQGWLHFAPTGFSSIRFDSVNHFNFRFSFFNYNNTYCCVFLNLLLNVVWFSSSGLSYLELVFFCFLARWILIWLL